MRSSARLQGQSLVVDCCRNLMLTFSGEGHRLDLNLLRVHIEGETLPKMQQSRAGRVSQCAGYQKRDACSDTAAINRKTSRIGAIGVSVDWTQNDKFGSCFGGQRFEHVISSLSRHSRRQRTGHQHTPRERPRYKGIFIPNPPVHPGHPCRGRQGETASETPRATRFRVRIRHYFRPRSSRQDAFSNINRTHSASVDGTHSTFDAFQGCFLRYSYAISFIFLSTCWQGERWNGSFFFFIAPALKRRGPDACRQPCESPRRRRRRRA